MSKKYHYVYGSGLSGCLYDNGPHFTERLSDAVESLSDTFSELPVKALQRMRGDLRRNGIHYFPRDVMARNWERKLESIRSLAGADYCQVSKVNGPCPEDET